MRRHGSWEARSLLAKRRRGSQEAQDSLTKKAADTERDKEVVAAVYPGGPITWSWSWLAITSSTKRRQRVHVWCRTGEGDCVI